MSSQDGLPFKIIDGVEIDLLSQEVSILQNNLSSWNEGQTKRDALVQIKVLESSATPRRIREAVLTDAGKKWLNDIDTQIQTLRGQLI